MPKARFEALTSDKQSHILKAALAIFSDASFQQASTNDIVALANISKGSLFTYFDSKEALYLDVLEDVIQALLEHYQQATPPPLNTMKETIIYYATLEFDWHLEHPIQYRFIKRAFEESYPPIKQAIQEKYQGASQSMFSSLLDSIALEDNHKPYVIQLLTWMMEGLNASFIVKMQGCSDLKRLKEDYLKELTQYLTIIERLF